MARLLALLALLLLPGAALAEPSDVDAAARGVVRVVILESDGERVYPISHGTGFAVSPRRIVTNAHVVAEAMEDEDLRIGVVPGEGDESGYARIVSVSPRNDLALIELTGDLRLSPLTIAGGEPRESGAVTSIGYPMNVDRAQGLEIEDVVRAQPPVTSRGFLSGARPSRQFDTILHTAPIARGNSGGPLVDSCGRVIGVNSFGAEAGGGDAEFYFAVSNRELMPFLRANDITPRVNGMPCRSLEEIDEAERERMERAELREQSALAREREAARANRERLRQEAELAVMTERENAMALAALLLLVGLGLAFYAWQTRRQEGRERQAAIAAIAAALAIIGALALWFTRPGLAEIDRRVAMAAAGEEVADDPEASAPGAATLLCTVDPSRSRVTGAAPQDLRFAWQPDGCVNGRTQYGYASGRWSRLFVPNEEDAVSINSFDPDSRVFVSERYLLGRNAMARARAERGKYSAPACEAGMDAATSLGEKQSAILALLPDSPNERLVYRCAALPPGAGEPAAKGAAAQ